MRPAILLTLGVLLLATKPNAWATSPAQADYMLNCQGCHLPEGEGYPARGVPALKGHVGKFLLVEGGREFLVQVPGSAMSDLSNQQLADVLNWILVSFNSAGLPKNFTPYSAEEVTQLRQSPLLEVTKTRSTLIDRIRQHENDS